MKKIFLTCVFLIIAFVAFAVTTDWSFTTATNYTFDSNKIEVSGGKVQFKTDFFDSSWKYRQAITVYNTSNTNALAEYQVELDFDSSNTDFWEKVNSDGSDVRFTASDKTTLLDHYLDSFDSSAQTAKYWVKVNSIGASTTETIYLYYGNSLATSASSLESTFSYSTPRTVGYIVSDLLAAGTLNVISLADSNQITDGTTTLNLDDQKMDNFSASELSIGTAIQAKKIFHADAYINSTDMISPVSWAGTEFYYYSYRANGKVFGILSPFGTATVNVYELPDITVPVWSSTVDSTGSTASVNVTQSRAIKITSDIPILVQHYTSTLADSYPFYPASTDHLYGIPKLLLFGGPAGASVNYVNSDGAGSSLTLSSNGIGSITVTDTFGTAKAYQVQSSQAIGANQSADGGGGEGTVFLPEIEMGTVFGSANSVNYIAIAAPSPNTTCVLYDKDGNAISTQTGGAREDVNKIYFNNVLSGGWKLVADKPVYAYYDKSGLGDETNLMSYKQMRQFTYPTPTVEVLSTVEKPFPIDNPTIQPVTSQFKEFQTISILNENATKNGGEIKYILSNDKGSTWLYFNSTNSSWEVSDETYLQSNTTTEVNANVISFPVGSGWFLFKAFLHSDGTQEVELDQVSLISSMLTPEVASYFPANGAINVSADSAISIQFSHTMDQPSVENAISVVSAIDNNNQAISEVVSGSFTWNNVRTAVFTPTVAFNKGYTFVVTVAASAMTVGGYQMSEANTFSFRTVFDKAKTSIYESTDQKAKVELDADAFSSDGYVIINRDPINDPTEVVAASIQSANEKTEIDGNPYIFPITSSITEFIAYDSSDTRITDNFDAPVTITLYYDDADDDGYVDNVSPPVKGEDLLLYRLDETSGLWVRVPGSTVDTDSKNVSAQVLHFSVYTLMSSPSLDLNLAYAYPVPFKPSEGHTTITFTNLASECTIRIYTISGNPVALLSETDGDGQYVWNVKNSSGFDLVSGVYLYFIQSASDVKTGKIMVIR